ncbi:hypothetical protein [Ornithinibacillus californiensis]|uniref:hypothetical protein n=1 Tax=Ornithinibacillus californiensis TaxID=161536 RepID=UPI00064DEA82|nr:hypothetical protein [Ornithinibacillus californiensis]
MAEDNKKPFYKKWWFWLIIAIIVLFALFGGGDEEDPVEEDTGTEETQDEGTDTNDDTTDEEQDTNEDTTEEPAEDEEVPADEPATRDNSSAQETTLNTGTFIVGEDIPAGRYVITGDGMGNLFVYDENGLPEVNEILDNSAEMGVTSVTTNLEDGQEIEISGINNVKFTPAETKISNTLSAGSWEVGLDIEPGRYNVTTPSGMGNFFVYNSMGLPTTNEILDASGELGVKQITVTLEEGQEIKISGLNEVNFEAR